MEMVAAGWQVQKRHLKQLEGSHLSGDGFYSALSALVTSGSELVFSVSIQSSLITTFCGYSLSPLSLAVTLKLNRRHSCS